MVNAVQVGNDVRVGQGFSGERQVQLVARGAVRAFRIDQVCRIDFFHRPVGVAQGGAHAGRRPVELGKCHHLRGPLHRHAGLQQPFAQDALCLGLSQQQDIIEAAVDGVQVDPAQQRAAVMQGGRKGLVPQRDHLCGKAALVQQFHGARMHGQRAGGGGRLRVLVHQAHGNAKARQLQGGGQAGGARTDDQYRTVLCHAGLHCVSGHGNGVAAHVKRRVSDRLVMQPSSRRPVCLVFPRVTSRLIGNKITA
jgi:hypothetical protein